MYIKNYKNFLPKDYIEKFNLKQNKKFIQGFILLCIFNLMILSINLNLEEKRANYLNDMKTIKDEELNDKEEGKSNIVNLKNMLENNILNNLLIKDNKFVFKVKEEELAIAIDIISQIGEINKLIYLNEEKFIQAEGIIN